VEERPFGQSDFGKASTDTSTTLKTYISTACTAVIPPSFFGNQKLSTKRPVRANLLDVDEYERRIAQLLEEIEAPPRPGSSTSRLVREALELVSVGADIYGREQKLTPEAAAAWQSMKTAAEKDSQTLQLVSAFRSVDYQKQIIQRKRAAGQSWEQILRVSALPGYSEHHTGRTIDVTTPDCKPLTEDFDSTSAFAWLTLHAAAFGFIMTYPPGNPLGVAYEPWHWTFHPRS
jgi:D-alanyl-D-alanine carboxypeptidase